MQNRVELIPQMSKPVQIKSQRWHYERFLPRWLPHHQFWHVGYHVITWPHMSGLTLHHISPLLLSIFLSNVQGRRPKGGGKSRTRRGTTTSMCASTSRATSVRPTMWRSPSWRTSTMASSASAPATGPTSMPSTSELPAVMLSFDYPSPPSSTKTMRLATSSWACPGVRSRTRGVDLSIRWATSTSDQVISCSTSHSLNPKLIWLFCSEWPTIRFLPPRYHLGFAVVVHRLRSLWLINSYPRIPSSISTFYALKILLHPLCCHTNERPNRRHHHVHRRIVFGAQTPEPPAPLNYPWAEHSLPEFGSLVMAKNRQEIIRDGQPSSNNSQA